MIYDYSKKAIKDSLNVLKIENHRKEKAMYISCLITTMVVIQSII